MKPTEEIHMPIGTKALIFSKHYYSVLSKCLEGIDVERYYSVLYFLYDNNGCNQLHICNNLCVEKTSMVKVIDYLIKSGFVDRNVNPDDRREHFIVLTKKGFKQTEEIVKCFQSIDKDIFSDVSDNDKNAFINVLSQLTDHLTKLPATDLFFQYKKTTRKKKKLSNISIIK